MSSQQRCGFLAPGKKDFGERVRCHAIAGRDGHTYSIGHGPAGLAIDQCAWRKISRRSGDRAIPHPQNARDLRRRHRIAQMDCPGYRSKNANVASGIYASGCDLVFLQSLHRPIDREALGDPAKIDHHAAAKSHRAMFFEQNVAPIPVARLRRSDVEDALAFARKIQRHLQDAPGPGMNHHCSVKGFLIDSSHIAGGIVKAHQPMHFFDCGKGCSQIARRSGTSQINNRSKQWAGPANFTV